MARDREMNGRRSREGVSGYSSRRDNSTQKDLNTTVWLVKMLEKFLCSKIRVHQVRESEREKRETRRGRR